MPYVTIDKFSLRCNSAWLAILSTIKMTMKVAVRPMMS